MIKRNVATVLVGVGIITAMGAGTAAAQFGGQPGLGGVPSTGSAQPGTEPLSVTPVQFEGQPGLGGVPSTGSAQPGTTPLAIIAAALGL